MLDSARAREYGKLGGRPKGSKTARVLRREAVLRALQERVMEAADLLFDAQFSLARGQQFLYKIEKYWVKGKKGKAVLKRKLPKLVTDPEEIRAYIERQLPESELDDDHNPAATYYFITTKPPDNKAIEGLKQTAFGKSIQPVALTDLNGNDVTDHESKIKAQKATSAFLSGSGGHPRARRVKRN